MSKADKMLEKKGFKESIHHHSMLTYDSDIKGMIQFNHDTHEVRVFHSDYDISTYDKYLINAIHEKMKEIGWLGEL